MAKKPKKQVKPKPDLGRENSKIISLRIGEDLLARVDDRAKADGVTRGRLLVDLASAHVKKRRRAVPAQTETDLFD